MIGRNERIEIEKGVKYLLNKTKEDEEESKQVTKTHDYVDAVLVSVNNFITRNQLNDPQNPINVKYKEYQMKCVKPATFATKEARENIKRDLDEWCKQNNIPIDENAGKFVHSIMGNQYSKDGSLEVSNRWTQFATLGIEFAAEE